MGKWVHACGGWFVADHRVQLVVLLLSSTTLHVESNRNLFNARCSVRTCRLDYV